MRWAIRLAGVRVGVGRCGAVWPAGDIVRCVWRVGHGIDVARGRLRWVGRRGRSGVRVGVAVVRL